MVNTIGEKQEFTLISYWKELGEVPKGRQSRCWSHDLHHFYRHNPSNRDRLLTWAVSIYARQLPNSSYATHHHTNWTGCGWRRQCHHCATPQSGTGPVEPITWLTQVHTIQHHNISLRIKKVDSSWKVSFPMSFTLCMKFTREKIPGCQSDPPISWIIGDSRLATEWDRAVLHWSSEKSENSLVISRTNGRVSETFTISLICTYVNQNAIFSAEF